MKKTPIFILTIVVILSVSSCDNGSDLLPYTIIEGKVLEYGTEEPIENAQVVLYEQTSSGTFSTSDLPIDTILTDATGSYSFQYNGRGQTGVKAFHDTYFPISRVPYENIYYKQRNVENIILDPYALLELHIKNVNPFDGNDRIGLAEFCDESYPEFFGANVDTTIICDVRGNHENNISWWVLKNGVDTRDEANIYCEGHEVTKYEIFY